MKPYRLPTIALRRKYDQFTPEELKELSDLWLREYQNRPEGEKVRLLDERDEDALLCFKACHDYHLRKQIAETRKDTTISVIVTIAIFAIALLSQVSPFFAWLELFIFIFPFFGLL